MLGNYLRIFGKIGISTVLLLTLVRASAAFNILDVIPYEDSTNAPTGYDIILRFQAFESFFMGSMVEISFPMNTRVTPGPRSQVRVNGMMLNQPPMGGGNVLNFHLPDDIGPGQMSPVVVSIQYGIENPSIPNPPGSPYQLMFRIDGNSDVASYNIIASSESVQVISATPSSFLVAEPAGYDLELNTKTFGYLWGGHSQVTIFFPDNTSIANGSLSNVWVGSFAATSAVGDSLARTITLIPAQTIPENNNYYITLPAAVIINPTLAKPYSLQISTSAQALGTSPDYLLCLPTATSTATRTCTATSTRTRTATPSRTPSYTITPTATPTATFTRTRTPTASYTVTPTRTHTPTDTATGTATQTLTRTDTPTITETSTMTTTFTATPTFTISTTSTITVTETATLTSTISPTYTISPTSTQTPTITLTRTVTYTFTPSPTTSITPTHTVIALQAGQVMAYPMPARGTTVWFYYVMPASGRANFVIYNLMGEQGEQLQAEHSGPGLYRQAWDIRRVAPGMYFYRLRLETAAGVQDLGVRKLVISK